jgi:hypothetical protein
MSEQFKGYTDAHEFRVSNQYTETERLFQALGLSQMVEDRTPTVSVNVAHLAHMTCIQNLKSEIVNRDLRVAILGLSSSEGPRDFQRLLKSLGAKRISTTALDISDGIFADVCKSGLDDVLCLERDARNTSLENETQDFVLRDHLGNCCPPQIDRTINGECLRILRKKGIAVANITTSELLFNSQGRKILKLDQLKKLLPVEAITDLAQRIYDLDELKKTLPNLNLEFLRGALIEIESNDSFVVFGEDPQGHGEWFRLLSNHVKMWNESGFEIMEIKTREGNDSHSPPLRCRRHNVVLRKK